MPTLIIQHTDKVAMAFHEEFPSYCLTTNGEPILGLGHYIYDAIGRNYIVVAPSMIVRIVFVM